jgi:hypothetical protein
LVLGIVIDADFSGLVQSKSESTIKNMTNDIDEKNTGTSFGTVFAL